jgi:hydrogenase nickel incorporation protein HypB
MSAARRLAVVSRHDLTRHERVARDLRTRFRADGVFVASVASSSGSGKTSLFERTLELLLSAYQVATIVADPAGESDAARLACWDTPVRQITTGATPCLDAMMIENALEGWDLEDFDFLLIENVGNMISPPSCDLGEDLRIVLVSVTEGEDMPLKYPAIFAGADVAVVTKMDLADAVEFNGARLHANLQKIHPGLPVFEVSAKTGWGMRDYVTWLETRKLERTLDQLGVAE